MNLVKGEDIHPYSRSQLDSVVPYSALYPVTCLSHSVSSSQYEVPCVLNPMFCFSDFSSSSEYLCLDYCSVCFWTFWDCTCPHSNDFSSFLFFILSKNVNPPSQASYSITILSLLLPLQVCTTDTAGVSSSNYLIFPDAFAKQMQCCASESGKRQGWCFTQPGGVAKV